MHSDAIKAVYNIDVDTDQQNLPEKVAIAYYEANKDKLDGKWKDSTSKIYLSKVFTDAMTYDLLKDRDPDDEIKGWFDKIASMMK